MRTGYQKKLDELHTELIGMGTLCENAIACAVKALIDEDEELREKVVQLEYDINQKEREIEDFCIRLLIREQPVASDLRQIQVAQKMIIDMERIGDQALDIAEISKFMVGSPVKSDVHIADMARATLKMLSDGVESVVTNNTKKAWEVVAYDDVVDALFLQIRGELIELMGRDSHNAGACLDLLMIAKYLERIGDHATNIAEHVIYAATGHREPGD